jgi:hypothetical protein
MTGPKPSAGLRFREVNGKRTPSGRTTMTPADRHGRRWPRMLARATTATLAVLAVAQAVLLAVSWVGSTTP